MMKIYLVGGAVRDELLGLAVEDRDYVVVGATPEEMAGRGYRPVGQGFPVFLHPDTKEEYALARTERKSGRGYKGFTFHAAPEVTLEEDLARRDLTINAMAKDVESGEIVDPFSGRRDLQQQQLRHVGPAFVEDPLRVLRVARFGARLSAFQVVPETLALMRKLVDDGEMQELVPERIWQEVARGLMEVAPQRMVDVLQSCGAWQVLVGEEATAPLLAALSRSAAEGCDVAVRYGVVCAYLRDGGENLHGRWKVPTACSDLAQLLHRQRHILARLPQLSVEELVHFLERCDVLRRPDRFDSLMQLWSCIASPLNAADHSHVRRAIAAMKAVDVEHILAADPHAAPAALIHQARVVAVRNLRPGRSGQDA